jgi:UDP-N-acetylglucosamine 4,6-dehydratase/5-epimerase
MKFSKTFLKNKTILVTGGTGSFGQLFVSHIIKNFKQIKKIIVFSRDELKQFEMSEKFPEKKFPKIRYFLGDLRDKDRIYRALDDVNIVVHAAALKQVPKAEYDPFEYIKTNIVGSQNLIEACLDKKVENVIALSTDKAVTPINLYGATKLCAEKLFIAANNIKGWKKIKFSVVRYGNVVGSRGSVIPYFIKQKEKGYLTITDEKMTRFNMKLEEAVQMVLWSLNKNAGGEIFVPKLPSYRILDLAKAIDDKCHLKFVGIRPGEKLDEELITIQESSNSYDLGKYFAILSNQNKNLNKFYQKKYKRNLNKFSYTSLNNKDFLKLKELKKIVNSFSKKLNVK